MRKGQKMPDEQKRKLSELYKGKPLPEETKKKLSKSLKGRVLSEETKRRMSETRKKKFLSGELSVSGERNPYYGRIGYWCGKSRPDISERMKGENNPMYGKVGDVHPGWHGGKSFEPYSTDWTHTLRRAIRERDRYICQLCGKNQEDIVFDIHHIDYNKKNCCPENLITLCKKCHVATNVHRNFWMFVFGVYSELTPEIN
jgi:hypothetical protein